MKLAAVQMDVRIGDVPANLAAVRQRAREAAAAGAELIVFPECALTGYCFDSREEALPHAQPIPGPATSELAGLSAELGAHLVVGLLESDGPRLFNAAVLIGPRGVIGSYRKVHLPFLGIDRFVDYGDRPFAVHEAGGVRLGMNICYDASFPEAARALTLCGAELVVLPTNWPPAGQGVARFVLNARAMENGVYVAAANRVGEERGFSFIGLSRICDPNGYTLATSSGAEELILYAEVDPAKARLKHLVRVAGKHEIDRLADRRPEMYAPLVAPHSLRRPGR